MKIAIVNDMLLAVEALRRVLITIPDYEVTWIARDGAEAVAKCAALRPDLILMDLLMPVMDGVEATRQIMNQCPCAILLVTSSINAHLPKVFEALGYGALDVVITPILGNRGYAQGGASLLEKISTISKLLGKSSSKRYRQVSSVKQCYRSTTVPPLVAIGASTGGPRAIAQVLSGLPKTFDAAIVVVQHIDVQFASSLSQWLHYQSPLPVELAIAGTTPEPGKVLLAGTNDHLIVRSNLTLTYTKDPLENPYRPSVDVFFKSVAQHWPGKGVGVLLTGMGRDGAAGLSLLRSAGWHTIAQDRKSCVVFGMPKAAIDLGAAAEVLPLDEIAPTLINL